MHSIFFVNNDLTLALLIWSLTLVLSLLAITVLSVLIVRLRNNRTEKLMRIYVPVFEKLAYQRLSPSDESRSMQTILPHKAFPLFERFLRNQSIINSDSVRNSYYQVAEQSGFLKRYRRTASIRKGWKQAIALRTLTYLSSPADIMLYKGVVERETFYPSIFCAAMGLAHCKEVGSFSQIIQRLCDIKTDNRDDILTILSAFGYSICPFILKHLLEFSPATQTVLIDFLRLHKHMEARKLIEACILDTKNLEVRIHAIEALGVFGSSDSRSILEPFLDNEDFRIRIKAVVAMSQIGGSEYLPVLMPMLEDPDWWVRRNTAEAIYALGEKGVAMLESLVHEAGTARGRMARMVIAEWKHGRKRWRYRFAESFS